MQQHWGSVLVGILEGQNKASLYTIRETAFVDLVNKTLQLLLHHIRWPYHHYFSSSTRPSSQQVLLVKLSSQFVREKSYQAMNSNIIQRLWCKMHKNFTKKENTSSMNNVVCGGQIPFISLTSVSIVSWLFFNNEAMASKLAAYVAYINIKIPMHSNLYDKNNRNIQNKFGAWNTQFKWSKIGF